MKVQHNVSEAESKRDFPVASHTYRYERTNNKVQIVMHSAGIGKRVVFEHDRVGGFLAAQAWAKQRRVVLQK